MLQNNIYKQSIYYLRFIYNDFFEDIQYCQKFKEIGGQHEEKLELKYYFSQGFTSQAEKS